MQAMCSRPPSGVGRQGPSVAASVRAQPPAQPPAPAPAPSPAPPPAPPPDPPVAQTQPASPAPAASPARAAAEKKKRAPRGAPDATNPPEATKRKRTTQVADTDKQEVEDTGKKYKNQSKIGMKYETTKKLGEKLRELMADSEADNAAAIQETLQKLMGAKKKKKGNTSATGDEDEEETVPATEVEKLKAEHAEELQRVNSELQDALAAMKAECQSKIDEAMQEEGKTAEEAESKLHELRIVHAAEIAKLNGKVELLEQQLVKAENEKMVAFVNGFNSCEMKMSGGAKTRSGGAHH